jgi:hypothetical protein
MIEGTDMPLGERYSLEIKDGVWALKLIPRSESGGGRLNIEKENEKWHIKLYTQDGEIYYFLQIQFDDAQINDAVRLRKDLEKAAEDGGSQKLLYMGGEEMWGKR